MIKTKIDPNEIVEFINLCDVFFHETCFKDFGFNPEQLEAFLLKANASDSTQVCVGAYDEEDKLIGVAAGYIHTMPFIKRKVATELFFYVSEEHRGSTASAGLLTCLEAWAKSNGAKTILFSANTGIIPEATDKFIKRNGYSPYGTNYMKEL